MSIDQNILNEVVHSCDLGRYDTALEKLDILLADSPNNGALLYLKADCLYRLDENHYTEAMDYCRQALANGYSLCKCNYLLGLIYLNTDKFPEAEECFLEALNISPQRADIMASYGYLMLRAGNKKKSRKLLDEALKLDPQNPVALHYDFFYYLTLDEKIGQSEALEQYMKISESEVRKLLKIGLMEYYNGHYKEAYESFRQAYLLEPTNELNLRLLHQAEEKAHFLYFPLLVVEKLGGEKALWAEVFAVMTILLWAKWYEAGLAVGVFYLLLWIYSMIYPFLYKMAQKRRG